MTENRPHDVNVMLFKRVTRLSKAAALISYLNQNIVFTLCRCYDVSYLFFLFEMQRFVLITR